MLISNNLWYEKVSWQHVFSIGIIDVLLYCRVSDHYSRFEMLQRMNSKMLSKKRPEMIRTLVSHTK